MKFFIELLGFLLKSNLIFQVHFDFLIVSIDIIGTKLTDLRIEFIIGRKLLVLIEEFQFEFTIGYFAQLRFED